MSREIDLSKPLTEADLKWMESRYPTNLLEYYKTVAGTKAPVKKDKKDDVL